MSATKAEEKTKSVRPGQLYLYGKIRNVEKFQTRERKTKYRTRVLMKGMDEFSYPKAYDVLSDGEVGKVGDLFEGIVDTATFVRDWETKPTEENGGEIRKISQIELSCFMPEAA